jgi:transcriptional regulator with XRE-family HTH domain
MSVTKILKMPPLDPSGETLGQRLARLRKERGMTQIELAAKVPGMSQVLLSDYERGRLRISAEVALRFALALDVSTDELLSPSGKRRERSKPSPKVLRRLQQIEKLPPDRQALVLKAIDAFVRAAER